MKQVLFEEDGAFRVGTILAEAGASIQVEAAHGKRSKVKAGSILLRFDGQSLAGFTFTSHTAPAPARCRPQGRAQVLQHDCEYRFQSPFDPAVIGVY